MFTVHKQGKNLIFFDDHASYLQYNNRKEKNND